MPRYVYANTYELEHAGIKGMKWGVRRYQNPDGSLTPEGKLRYNESGVKGQNKYERRRRSAYNSTEKRFEKGKISKQERDNLYKSMKMTATEKDFRKAEREYINYIQKVQGRAQFLAGPVAGLIALGIATNYTSKGRRLSDTYAATKIKYNG